MTALSPVVNADMPSGAVGSWFIGQADTIRGGESGIRTAIAEARRAGGVNLTVRFLDAATGRCRYLARVKQPEATSP
jgi:hypothetical protein